jgi:hypothetical protein
LFLVPVFEEFQVAIWKAEYETNSADYNILNAGALRITGLNSNVSSLATSYLNASLAAGGGSAFATDSALWVNYYNVTGDHPQFQLMTVPEPSSLALQFAGLGTLGLFAYGRARRAKPQS